jgi:hypothetical protein
MRIIHLLENRNNYLYEGLGNAELRSVKLWESAGHTIKEAALTPDQIQSLFAEIEKGATASGDNRTVLGKGKDAAEAVNKAWVDLKDKIYNSKPMSDFAAQYDKAAEKLKQATGGDAGAMKYINKYRKFAEEHPILQGAIYAALIAAAGITGVAPGGAALLGLFKLVDQAIQGKDIRSAMWSGVKTGAAAYGSAKLGQFLKGTPTGDVPSTDEIPTGFNARPDDYASAVTAPADVVSKGYGAVMKSAMSAGRNYAENGGLTDASSIQSAAEEFGNALAAQGLRGDRVQTMVDVFKTSAKGAAARALGGTAQSTMGGALQAVTNSINRSGKRLSEGQVYMIFNRVARENITEGPMDAIKGFAGKAMDKIKTVGTNLTTKVTADKLNSAWQKAGNPTDSDELAQFLEKQGVNADIVKQVYGSLKIPAPGSASTAAPATDIEAVKKIVAGLPTDRKVRLLKFLEKGGTSKSTAPAATTAAPEKDSLGRIEPTMS